MVPKNQTECQSFIVNFFPTPDTLTVSLHASGSGVLIETTQKTKGNRRTHGPTDGSVGDSVSLFQMPASPRLPLGSHTHAHCLYFIRGEETADVKYKYGVLWGHLSPIDLFL